MARFPALLLVAALMAPAAASSQSYPARPVRVYVGAAPGGTTDIVARLVAQRLGERLGQQFVVENRPGAAGNLANDAAAKAAPDGYTLAMAYSGLSINPAVMPMPFDTLRDLAPVSLVASVQMFLVVSPELPAKSVGELVALARTQPGTVALGANSLASVSHLAAELFRLRAGVDVPVVVYKGSAPALVDMMGGRLAAMFDTFPGALPHVKSGKIRAIAVGGATRAAILPDVPTLAEAGLPDFEIRSWYGVIAPAPTPPAIVDRLSAEIAAAVKSPDLRERFEAQTLEPVGSTPAEFAAFIRAEMDRWAPAARAAKIRTN